METLQPHVGPSVAGVCERRLAAQAAPPRALRVVLRSCVLYEREQAPDRGLSDAAWGSQRCVSSARLAVCVRAWGTRGQRVLMFCVCFLWDKPGREDPSVSVVWMGPRARPWCLLGTGVIALSGVAAW